MSGSPPQVRGKLSYVQHGDGSVRITPAGAGKTYETFRTVFFLKDHPRRCGENTIGLSYLLFGVGSPPQVRGKLYEINRNIMSLRITPAGAGKTTAYTVCGIWMTGSPPQVRGKQHNPFYNEFITRITPAGAGKTVTRNLPACFRWDHPRRCGEN